MHPSTFALLQHMLPVADRRMPFVEASNRVIARQVVSRHEQQIAERATLVRRSGPEALRHHHARAPRTKR